MFVSHRLLVILAFILIIQGCNSISQGELAPSVVSMKGIQNFSTETQELHRLQIILDAPQLSETIIHFKVNGSALEKNHTRFGDADFQLLTVSPLVIPAGSVEGNIEYRILEDSIYESQEHLTFDILGISEGNAVLHHIPGRLTFTHYIFEEEPKPFTEYDGDAIKMNNHMVLAEPELGLVSN